MESPAGSWKTDQPINSLDAQLDAMEKTPLISKEGTDVDILDFEFTASYVDGSEQAEDRDLPAG